MLAFIMKSVIYPNFNSFNKSVGSFSFFAFFISSSNISKSFMHISTCFSWINDADFSSFVGLFGLFSVSSELHEEHFVRSKLYTIVLIFNTPKLLSRHQNEISCCSISLWCDFLWWHGETWSHLLRWVGKIYNGNPTEVEAMPIRSVSSSINL